MLVKTPKKPVLLIKFITVTLKMLQLPDATLVLLHQCIIFLQRTGAKLGIVKLRFVYFDLSYLRIAVDHDLIVFLI